MENTPDLQCCECGPVLGAFIWRALERGRSGGVDPSPRDSPAGPPRSCPGLPGSCPLAVYKCLLGKPGNKTTIRCPLTPL